MDDRAKIILQAIVDDYVETCEPIGSKALVERHQLNLSSATVRNVMAELEEQGYIEKPHTSAGRMPSDKGYRAYVENILKVPPLSAEEEQQISDFLTECMDESGSLIEKAADYLAAETDFVSVALSPRYGSASLQQVKILMIEPGRALVVVVLSAGVVRDKLIRIPELISAEQLNSIAAAIEKTLKGTQLKDITLITVVGAAEDAVVPEPLLNQVAYDAYVAIKQAEEIDVYMDGTTRLLEHPEFSDLDTARGIFRVMQTPHMVAGYMAEWGADNSGHYRLAESGQVERMVADADADSAMAAKNVPAFLIRIGQEITLDGLSGMSFISTLYRMDDCIGGQIGVIGPRRMQYGKIISQIHFLNKKLNQLCRRKNGDE